MTTKSLVKLFDYTIQEFYNLTDDLKIRNFINNEEVEKENNISSLKDYLLDKECLQCDFLADYMNINVKQQLQRNLIMSNIIADICNYYTDKINKMNDSDFFDNINNLEICFAFNSQEFKNKIKKPKFSFLLPLYEFLQDNDYYMLSVRLFDSVLFYNCSYDNIERAEAYIIKKIIIKNINFKEV